LSRGIRKKIIDKHVKGKGYKTISKQLDVPVTTVAHIVQKFKVHGTVANLPGLQGQGTSVSDRTIPCCLSQSGLHGRRLRRTLLLKAYHKKARLEFAKMHIDKPQSFWENVLCTDETKMELFGKSHQLYVHRRRNEAYKEKNTVPTVMNMKEARLCSGAALLLLAQGVLNLCRVQ